MAVVHAEEGTPAEIDLSGSGATINGMVHALPLACRDGLEVFHPFYNVSSRLTEGL